MATPSTRPDSKDSSTQPSAPAGSKPVDRGEINYWLLAYLIITVVFALGMMADHALLLSKIGQCNVADDPDKNKNEAQKETAI